jgi:photosystem II stability/assembly factor-like uncharacterized protein
MPRLLVALCILLVLPVGAVASSTATLIDAPVQDLFSLDRQHLWVLVNDKNRKEFLFSTTDGGEHWIASPSPFTIWRVFFVDPDKGWGIAAESSESGVKTFCVYTSDSGRTWKRLAAITKRDERPTGIAFDSREHGWIVGEGYSGIAFVLETIDGGEHWTRLAWKTRPASGLYGVRVHNGYGLTWSGGAGGSGIYELRHGSLPKRISDRETMDFALVSEDSIVAASQSAVHLRIEGSSAWETVLESSGSTFRDMSFVDSGFGCVAGGEIYCTNDGGRTWSSRPLPLDALKKTLYLYKLYFIDRLRGWAVSGDAIFETDDGALSWAKVDFFDGRGVPLAQLHRN